MHLITLNVLNPNAHFFAGSSREEMRRMLQLGLRPQKPRDSIVSKYPCLMLTIKSAAVGGDNYWSAFPGDGPDSNSSNRVQYQSANRDLSTFRFLTKPTGLVAYLPIGPRLISAVNSTWSSFHFIARSSGPFSLNGSGQPMYSLKSGRALMRSRMTFCMPLSGTWVWI